MKKLLSIVIFGTFLILTPSLAIASDDDKPTYTVDVEFLSTGDAKFKDVGITNQHLNFQKWQALSSYTHHIGSHHGLVFELGYSSDKFDWKENPAFTESTYNSLNFGIGTFSSALTNWLWKGGLYASVDTEEFDFTHYALYSGTLWGRYTYSDNIDIHIGIHGNVGMKKDEVYPIIGLQYSPDNRWKLNLVYPQNLSAIYSLNDLWSVSLIGEFFKNRHRVSKNAGTMSGGAIRHDSKLKVVWRVIEV